MGLGLNWSVIESGGTILVVIILLNIYGVGVMIAKWVEFYKAKRQEKEIRQDIVGNVTKKISSSSQYQKDNQQYLLEVIRSEIAFYIHKLDSSLATLKLIAMLAPLLGLLGTVWGILLCFSIMAEHGGSGDPVILADGISKALITTVAGLVVAILHHLVFHYFSGKIQEKEMVLEESITKELMA